MPILPTLRGIVVGIVVLALFALPPRSSFAVISSCTASVDMHSVPPNSTNSMSFTVTNGGSSDGVWIKITRPSSNFVIAGGASTPGGWSSSVTESDMTVTGGTLSPSGSYTFSVQVSTTNTTASSADWTVQLSDDSGGASPTGCTGSLGTAIEGSVSVPDPTISDIVVSDISDTQATITWTTDVAGTSVVDYGTTTDYGSTSSDTSYVTSHNRALTGLTANTTYHYNIKSTRSEGNTGESGDNTFVTAKQGTTTTTTVTGTTKTVTGTPTPTPIPDRTPPRVSLTTKFAKFYTKAPSIEGKATDPSGVDKIEYSTDAGRNWLPVDQEELGGTSETFSFTPFGLEDGNYLIEIRGTDGKGNRGIKEADTLVIDRLPPQVGIGIVSVGPQVVHPAETGEIFLVAGLDYKITLSAIGGPTEIEILSNPGVLSSLGKNPDSGLWRGVFRFDAPGSYELTARAVDGAQNITSRKLFAVSVLDPGVVTDGRKPLEGVNIAVYYLDRTTRQFSLWDGRSYGQENPQKTTRDGTYRLSLPPGTYYLNIGGGPFTSLLTSLVVIGEVTPVTQSFAVGRRFGIRIGPFLLAIPEFRQSTVALVLATGEGGQSRPSPMIGRELPFATFAGNTTATTVSFRGKPTILTFFAPWDPSAASQLTIVSDIAKKKEINVAAIALHETGGAVVTYAKRAGYTVPIFADHDGSMVTPLSLIWSPTHVILDRRGVVEGVYSGIMTKEELLDTLIQ